MSSCGIDLELIRSVVDAALLDRLEDLRELMCCGDTPAPTPPPSVDKFITGLAVTSNEIISQHSGKPIAEEHAIKATRNDGTEFEDYIVVPYPPEEIKVTGLSVTPKTDQSGELVGHDILLTQTDNTDFTITIPASGGTPPPVTVNTSYRIVDVPDDYTTLAADFDGRTILRATKDGDQYLTITRPDDAFVGKSLIIRKVAGDTGTFVYLDGQNATLSPPDAVYLRRVGSTATLVYVGGGVWDIYGELP